MTTLITGGHGFLGSRVAHLYPSAICPDHDECDLIDADATNRCFSRYRPNTVIHLAAEVGGIGANRAQPGRFFYANMQMGLNVLEACRFYHVSKLVMVGTVCAYPKYTPVPFSEDSLWDGYPEETNAPYGVAKRALLTGCRAYREQYGLNAIYLLPVNLYGPGDDFDPQGSHVIPALIRKMVDAVEGGEESVTLWGDGTPTREFLHVRDAARAIRMAEDAYNGADPVNIGSGKDMTIAGLADIVRRQVGYTGKIIWDKSMPNGQPIRRLNVDKARDLFGFEALIPFEEGIAETVAWYQESMIEQRPTV